MRTDHTPLELELIRLLAELIDLEGPQPGNVEWYLKVVNVLKKVNGDTL